jgi:bacterioferritin
MKGTNEILQLLGEVLAGELVAINQYFVHSKMCGNWGYGKLASHGRSESIDEMKHAESLVDRILFLEGVPNLQRLDKLNIGETVPEQLKSDLALESAAVKRLNDGIALCLARGDATTMHLLQDILASEERHVDWLETQLRLIEHLGEVAYLAEQMT